MAARPTYTCLRPRVEDTRFRIASTEAGHKPTCKQARPPPGARYLSDVNTIAPTPSPGVAAQSPNKIIDDMVGLWVERSRSGSVT